MNESPGNELDADVLKRRAVALARRDPSQVSKVAGDLQESKNDGVTEEVLELLEFRLVSERYAVETRLVHAVYPLKNLASIPCTPAFVAGVVILRGQIVTVISLKHFFNLPDEGLTDLHRIVLIGNDDMDLGILADVSVGVVQVAKSSLQRAPGILAGLGAKYVQGVTADGLIVLDAENILQDPALLVDETVT